MLKTPATHPEHPTVGHIFEGGWEWGFWYCDSYDPEIGFWMTRVGDPSDRRNVSERTIGRTFHKLWDERVSMIHKHPTTATVSDGLVGDGGKPQ